MSNFINPVLGENVLVQVQDASNASLYAHTVIINKDRNVSFTPTMVDDDIVDLDDQGKPAQKVRRVSAIDLTVGGSGSMNAAAAAEYTNWAANGTIRNIRVKYANTTIQAPFALAQFDITANRVEAVQASVSFQLAGPMVITANV